MIKSLALLMDEAKEQKKMKLVVAAAQEEDVLLSVYDAYAGGIIEPILVGDEELIRKMMKELSLNFGEIKIYDFKDLNEAALESVKLVASGQADFLMKGLIDTSILLKAVLNKEFGLRTESLISHVMVYELSTYHKLLFLTDGGMNIEPNYDEKVKITKNAIDVAKAMGNEVVKVAILAAKEKVNDKMVSTVHADMLQKHCEQGGFGENVIVEGPLAFDLAISAEAARIKKFNSQISGDVDVLVVPTIEVGNGIGKALTYLANANSAGIIMGAKAPVVLTSRADSKEAKLYSIALGSVVACNK
jgi:phosphate butyryltransferase